MNQTLFLTAEAGGYYRLSRPVNIFDFRDDR